MNNQTNTTNSNPYTSADLSNNGNWLRKLIIVLVIIGFTAACIFLLFKFKPEAKKERSQKLLFVSR